MESSYKVSIITVTYNSERYIASCIDSILKQDYSNIELIVVDGASTDQTINIVKAYEHKITKLVSEPDEGIYHAMNKGISLAEGDVVAFLNSDDFYSDEQVISKVIQTFATTKADSVYADLFYVNALNTEKIVRRWVSGTFSRRKFLYGWMPPHPTFFVKKSVFTKFGNFNLTFKTAADYELMLRFLYKYQVTTSYLPEYIVKMRVGGLSNSSLRHRLFANQEDRLAWKINGLTPYFFTLILKPLQKIIQYL